MASTLWLSLCLVLLVHNLMDLVSDRHQLSYKIVEEGNEFFDEDQDLNYLVCTPFWIIQHWDTLTYEPATQNASATSFLNHSIVSIERQLKVTDMFYLNESAIFNEHVCFPSTKSGLEEEGKHFNEFFKVYGLFKIFIYSKEKQPNFYEKAYEKMDNLPSIYVRAYKQKVFGENHLLNAGCSNRAHQIHHDRFTCLNTCFKELKISSGFYRFDDKGTFDLRKILQGKRIWKREVNNVNNKEGEALRVLKKRYVPSNTEGVERCLRRCPDRSCFWEVVITLKIYHFFYENHLQQEGKEKLSLHLNTYVAFYSMDDFYMQLFGLLAIFTGTSILRLLHALFSLALSVASRKIEPLNKNEKLLKIFRLLLRNLKKALTLLSLLFILVQGLAMVNDFRFHSNYPNRTSTLSVSSKPFSVVICFPLGKQDTSTLKSFSFDSIEEATKNLIKTEIKYIDILSGTQQIEPDLHISDEVLFKSRKSDDGLWLSRCFRVDLNLDERYRKIPLTYLRIKFYEHRENPEIFLIEKHQNFTSGLVNFRGLFYSQKVTKKRSKSSVKSNCRDYSKEPNCGSRRNCLNQCLSTTFIKKHMRMAINTVVSKNDLNPYRLMKKITFSETVDTAIEEKCSTLFNQIDCKEVRFEESPELVKYDVDSSVSIRLIYLHIVEKEMEYDPLKTLLDIIGLETILFGSNALGVMTTVLLFLCRTLRLKWRRAYSVFLLLLASAGFLAHNVLVFRTIISGDLNKNEFFEKPQRYTLPSPILCFPIGKELDENHRVTGKYMDQLTGDLTFQHIIQEVQYVNRTHKKVLHIYRLNSTKSSSFYSSPELELSHFYLSGMKCFKISLRVSYREKEFFLQRHKTVLKIFLDRSFANRMKHTTFLHQQADSKEIGGGFNYRIGEWKVDHNYYHRYNIEFELFRIVREDQFELLKDPRRLFQERVKVNDARTVEVMRKRFKENYNRTTDHLPLDKHFDVEMDNELYEQHMKTTIDQFFFNSLDFEQNIANSYTNVYYIGFEHNEPHFSFSFSFLERRVVITNRENYTKLVVSLLNTLSLWLDICVIDIGTWLSRFFAFALHLYRLLIKTRNRLKRLSK